MQPVIQIENVSKLYKLGYYGANTFRDEVLNFFARLRGKPAVNSIVGATNNLSDKDSDTDLVWALKDINLTVNQGDIVGIIGKNGAGKSTLLKILSKITAPTTGSIKIRGRIASLLEVGTGMHQELTGRENIFLNGAILGMTKHEINSKLDEIIDFAGIAKYIDTPIKRYSSGMRVRLGFAIAAHLDPEILIVDEVLAVGDAEFQKRAIGKMQDISKGEGRTVLFVSHNMTSIKNLCKTGVLMKNGMIEFEGEIDETVDKYLTEQEIRSNIKISDIKDRQGDGKLRFTNLLFYDKNHQEKDTFEVGESIIIRVMFKIYGEIENAKKTRIDIGINDIFDNRVTWLSTYMFSDKIDLSKNFIDFTISKIVLNEGTYNINLFCQTDNDVSDWIKNTAKLNIVFHDYYKNGRTLPPNQGNLLLDYEIH
ncbi:MAG: ABC transporter ATP-binding protein [Alphaproteobacteria bacterium]|nr:ABC transporter ATP-binding protein [Alphaproteobacteria bacterium]